MFKSHKSRAGIATMRIPASKNITSGSVELCETAGCSLHIQPIGTKVRLPKMHTMPPEVDFESSRSPCKIGVLRESQSALLGRISHMTILPERTRVMNVRNQPSKRLSQALVNCENACASLFSDHRKSVVPMRSKYEHMRTIRKQTLDNSTIFSSFSFLNW